MGRFDQERWEQLRRQIEIFTALVATTADELRSVAETTRHSKQVKASLMLNAERLDNAVQGLTIELRAGEPELSLLRSLVSVPRFVCAALIVVGTGSLEDAGQRFNTQIEHIIDMSHDVDGSISLVQSGDDPTLMRGGESDWEWNPQPKRGVFQTLGRLVRRRQV